MFEICRSKTESDKISDFVAIGNLVSNEDFKSYHAAIIIKYDEILYEFHYTSKTVELVPIKRDYYHKVTNVILAEEVPSFIALCKQIEKSAKPIYGMFYSGEFYKDGVHNHDIKVGERMTCVGFCLNVFKTFLEEDYIEYEDWGEESLPYTEYLTEYCKMNGLNPKNLTESARRITPRECLTSCFFDKLPISKAEIHSKIEDVNQHFILRFKLLIN